MKCKAHNGSVLRAAQLPITLGNNHAQIRSTIRVRETGVPRRLPKICDQVARCQIKEACITLLDFTLQEDAGIGTEKRRCFLSPGAYQLR